MTEHRDRPAPSSGGNRLLALAVTLTLTAAVVVAVVLSRSAPEEERTGSRPGAGQPAAVTADGIECVVAVRDSRRTDGVWVLTAKAQDDEPHPTTDVLTVVLAGVSATYG